MKGHKDDHDHDHHGGVNIKIAIFLNSFF